MVMTNLNTLTSSWKSFTQGICCRRKPTKFNWLWEECTQQEARLVAREEKMGNDEDQALTTHTKKEKRLKYVHISNKYPKFHNFQRNQRDYSNIRCYNYQKMGNIARYCP